MENMLVDISSQWLAIVLSAAIVWVASGIVWMVLPHHKSDYKGLPDENAAINALRPQNLKPGLYNIPHCTSWDDAKKDDVKEKFAKGPVAYLTVAPNGMPNMGKSLVLSFVFYLGVGVLVAYLLSRTVTDPNAEYLTIFRIAGTVSWMTYGVGSIMGSIWFAQPWSITIKYLIDSLLYGLLTAGVFAWLWPV